MSGVASPGEIFDGGGVPFADPETKKRWAKNRVKLGIVAVSNVQTQYGDKVRFEVVEQGQSDRLLFDMSSNDVRVRQARAINELLMEPGVKVVAPVYLMQIPTDKGNPAWVFSKDPGDGVVADIEESGAAPVAAGSVPSDDIPF